MPTPNYIKQIRAMLDAQLARGDAKALHETACDILYALEAAHRDLDDLNTPSLREVGSL